MSSMAGVGSASSSGESTTWAARHEQAPAEMLEQAVRAFFPPDAPCSIEIETRGPAEGLQGRFSKFHLELSPTTVKGMPVQSAAVDLQDFALDLPLLRTTGKIRVFSAAQASYTVAIPEAGLNWLLAGNKRLGKDRPPRLELQKGQVVLSGRIRTDLFASSFRLKGALAARKDKEVHFIPDSVSVGRLHLPAFLMDVVAGSLNPVATIGKFAEMQRCNLRIREIVVTPGLLTVSG
ncbi:MAG: DUF2993 domain-containing protein [Candidatus Riflebacteria bacterium]|nr:DUF2993 domain-containing protein [Candidatus Riflebacteria bacterium]